MEIRIDRRSLVGEVVVERMRAACAVWRSRHIERAAVDVPDVIHGMR